MRRLALALVLLILVAAGGVFAYLRYLGQAGADPAFFSGEIEAFLAADLADPPAPGQIVFVGSSSIRFWESLAEDMAPLRVVRRGFGGAQLSHLVHEAPRIVVPYAPRAVVVYAGDNDLAAGKSVDTVVADFEALVRLLHAALPETDVHFISIKPSPLRAALEPERHEANARIQALAVADPHLDFIEAGSVLLGADGKPRRELFRFDGLHLDAEGYAAWTSVIRPVLIEAYGASPVLR